MESLLELDAVTFRYSKFTVGPLSLELPPGRAMGLVGPNGSGKTTTLHCTIGLLRPRSGDIRFRGVSVLTRPKWRQEVGFIPDDPKFYERWSAFRNLEFLAPFYPNWSMERAEEVARRLDLNLDQKPNQMSKGQRMKVSITAALAIQPKLLIMDEPTGGLDPVVRTEFLELLHEFMAEDEERSLVYSTHILSDIGRLADTLTFIRDGQVLSTEDALSLEETWRKVSFIYPFPQFEDPSIVEHRNDGDQHLVTTQDVDHLKAALEKQGARITAVNRMSVEEIAVQILKNGR